MSTYAKLLFFFRVILNYKKITKFYTLNIRFCVVLQEKAQSRVCKSLYACILDAHVQSGRNAAGLCQELLIRGVTQLHFQEYCPYKNYKAFFRPTPLITSTRYLNVTLRKNLTNVYCHKSSRNMTRIFSLCPSFTPFYVRVLLP